MSIIKISYCLFLTSLLFSCSSPNKEETKKEIKYDLLSRENTDFALSFNQLTAENIIESAEKAIQKADVEINALINSEETTYETTLAKLDKARYYIAYALYPLELLYETHPDEAIRKGAYSADEKLKEYLYALDIQENVYKKIQAFAETEEAKKLTNARKTYLEELLLKYQQSGMSLPEETRNEVKKLKQKIDQLGNSFRSNIASLTQDFILSPKDTAGINQELLVSKLDKDGNYRFDMSYPSYDAVMKYAHSDAVKKGYMLLFKNRGMPGNVLLLDSILYFRGQLANQLGYDTYADYAVATRMAKSPENVWDFVNEIKDKVKIKAEQDYTLLLETKSKLKGTAASSIEEWELSYISRVLKKEQFELDEEKISEYFELNAVIEGVFQITQKLLGLRYEKIENPNVWHKDVSMYHCYDDLTGKLIGRFYLDLFPRENKYSHAACFPMNNGLLLANGDVEIAEASLVCNFTQPTEGKPSLLRVGEVETFFHEFGHLVHCMIAKSEVAGLSGIETVKLDFVEAPSQIYENWAYLKETLSVFAKHYKTGEIIPDNLIEKIIEVKNVNSGLDAQRQVFYGTYDMMLHHKYVPFAGETTTDVAKKLYDDLLIFNFMEGTNFEASFGHLVGYAAGYYGYMWSKVFAQDMWSVFEEKGPMNQELGLKYRNIILAPGGSKDQYEMVVEFLGRKPNSDALLKELGVK
jgi:thimet oligopeptidase